MIQLRITQTAKMSPKDKYCIYNEYKQTFPTLAIAKAWLKDEYGNCKRSYIYQGSGETTKRIGYVYHFRDRNDGGRTYWRQDWAHFYKITSLTI